jgi:hypothetical protein
VQRVAGVAVAALAILLGIVGCGGSSLSASSSCQDFSSASSEEQSQVISKLSSEYDTPDYTTPLGEPEVGYYCAGNSETTLQEFFEQAQSEGG